MKRFSQEAKENMIKEKDKIIYILTFGSWGLDEGWLFDMKLISEREYEDLYDKEKRDDTTYQVLNDISREMVKLGIKGVKQIRKLSASEIKKYSTNEFLYSVLGMFHKSYDFLYNYPQNHNGENTPRYYEMSNYCDNFTLINKEWYKRFVAFSQDYFVSERERSALGLALEKCGILYVK